MIEWVSFLIVFAASLFAACTIVALYSLGIRFLATPARVVDAPAANGPARDDEDDDIEMSNRPRWATVVAYSCFALSAVGVLFGIYLIVPALHG